MNEELLAKANELERANHDLQPGKDVQHSADRFRALVEATAEIVWTTAPDGRVVEDSPSWRAFTGQTLEEWRGSGWLDVVHPEDRARVAARWEAAVSGGAVYSDEFRLRKAASGEWRNVSVRAVPVLNADGTVREWVGMNTDVTERKEAEEALREAKKAAERAAEAKSQFLATMSHELRTPLTAVIGISDLMETGVIGPMNEEQRGHLARIRSSAWHLVAIIEEVLTYSRSEAGRTYINRTTVDLAALAREVVDVLQIEAEAKGVKVTLAGADDPVVTFSDGGKLRQIITNLVGNAVKFTDDGAISVELDASKHPFQVRVRDTGPGIPNEILEAIFEPFVQGDSSNTRVKGGAGLGLAVSRRLARLLGGDVTVRSAPGEGSVFTLRIPRDQDGEAKVEQAPKEADAGRLVSDQAGADSGT